MSIDAMKAAMEALEATGADWILKERAAKAALRTAIEQAEKAGPVAWQHHARKLTQWLHCMSYNDSYFGEPAGLVKQVTGELNRLIGAAPPQRQPLTKEQRKAIEKANTIEGYHGDYYDAYGIMDDVEAAHGIGGDK